ncbi:unnamed protein product, partial [Candidula unifasciata]
SLEDQANKLHRRTSYLMATARDRTNNAPLEMTFSSPHLVTDHAAHSSQHHSSVKLNRFFGEVIPSIAEVSETRLSDHEDPLEVIRKGPLLCKISVIEGKKCSDRSWKPVYAILRPAELFLTRDRESGLTSSCFEDQHIPLKLCMVEFARDYAKKKKNVFRMSTYSECEYLFQAEDRGTLMCWIQGIKSINEPMKTEKLEEIMSADREKLMHSPVEIHTGFSSKMSPQLGHKGRKLSALSFKSKLSSSPNMKRKKSNAADKEEVIKKGWMDRIPMMKSLKKHSDDSAGLALAEHDMDSNKFQFGVPLEFCFPSPHNEYVPLIVELCTRIVEARGLECVGVYRVPGNSAAVNALTEEFNRGIDSVNIDNEKLLDINVISSLLKSFFRKLPEPLIPAESYDDFIEANRCPDENKRKLKLKRFIHLLPPHQNETFKHMAEHLNKVASYGNINKMDAKNLAIMFGPTLIRKKGDDTVSLVTDMSDQCRIVESTILHHEWFFGPWDQDSHIPTETTVETVPVDDGQSQSKDDDEEADSAISTKEIISSIVGAASKKLRQKQQKKSLESLDTVDSSSIASTSTYRDRSRDDSLNLTQSLVSIASSLSDSEENSASRLSVSSSPYPLLGRSDLVNKGDFKKSEYLDISYQVSPSFPRPQQQSDFLYGKHGELGTSAEPAGLSQDAISRLKRIGDDVSALLHTFEQKQLIEREHRRREKELVEREHLRTQLELEQEENHSVDDWLEWKGSLATARMPDLVSSSYVGDTFSYNQNQSSCVAASQDKREQSQRKISLGVQADVDCSSQSLSYKAGLAQAEATTFGQSRMSRGGSHEDILSQCKNMGHNAARPVVMRGPCQRRLQENQQKVLAIGGAVGYPLPVRNSFGRRHGSLDSLIDMIDKQDKRASWASSDSEDGSDLLTSITATFDQKLQILLNPKYKLTGTGKRCSRNEVTGSTIEGMVELQNDTIHAKLPVVTNTKQIYTVNTMLDSYRDPSLHRSARSDPKIGIASRFERNDITRTASSSPVTSLSNTGTNLRKWSKRQLPDFKAFLGKPTSPSKDTNSVILTKPKKLENRVVKTRNVSDRRELGLVFKSSKEDNNQSLNTTNRQANFFLGDKPPTSRQILKEEKTDTINLGARPRQRRHTVGGVEDLAHISALSQVCSDFNLWSCPTKLSAWDQLQPAVSAPGSRDMQAWLRRERLRGSTPDLSVVGLF